MLLMLSLLAKKYVFSTFIDFHVQSIHFHTYFPLGRVVGTAVLVSLKITQNFLQSLMVLLAQHQEVSRNDRDMITSKPSP